jgi:hypothetical protein
MLRWVRPALAFNPLNRYNTPAKITRFQNSYKAMQREIEAKQATIVKEYALKGTSEIVVRYL